jgi:hypothetical protein
MSSVTPSPVLYWNKYNHARTNWTSGDTRENEIHFSYILAAQMATLGFIVSEISVVINYLHYFRRNTGDSEA